MWFLLVSAFYVSLLGLVGGAFVDAGYELATNPLARIDNPLRFSGEVYWVGAAAWGVLVLLLQFHRVRKSLGRTRSGESKPLPDVLFNLEVALHFKCIILFLLIVIVAGIVRVTRGMPLK
jgi:hypothetical protein